MSGAPDHRLTVKWALFSFRGRIGRKTFWLGALAMVLIQAALLVQLVATPEDSPIFALWTLLILVSWAASSWAALALAVKRLHDIGLPGVLAVLLLVPAVSFFAFLVLAFWPSLQEPNAHGPPPFPQP